MSMTIDLYEVRKVFLLRTHGLKSEGNSKCTSPLIGKDKDLSMI